MPREAPVMKSILPLSDMGRFLAVPEGELGSSSMLVSFER
jgi:hypothetical protein